ncbi:hypothetical protein I6A84_05915 [Frankia sp. CNm7]|uniref:Zinc-finger domain-containing protein n=1 Tax=Frankia nepalensis TaxID=1836974 RepID=A0A937RF11_9ACTN|nr:hypothetical protein [Frankia nepalensis]MBL7496753.1 hypothetical protein [Frankia nepalensis]MBL7510425.1 hypothetical protein [Frankia nepalensis]MBL7517672.1 hypothetical protein [Frankia nepalensis]MBL7630981.1 hypothetical protein [Frankia nepalensis]
MGSDARGETRHPEDELLDAYADGERTPGSVDRHVRLCADCQRVVVALRDVRGELARLAPITMPPDVARRIQEALSAAPVPAAPPASRARRGGGRRSPGGGRPPTFGSAAAPRPSAQARQLVAGRSARPERLVMLAACLLVVVAGVGLFAGWQRGGSDSADTAASAALPASAPTMSAYGDAAGGSAGGQERALAAGVVALADSGAVLTSDDVPRHARDLLAGRVPVVRTVSLDAVPPAADAPGAASSAAPTTSTFALASGDLTTSDLLGCYQKLAATLGGSVLALDRISYGGRGAVLVVVDIPDFSGTSTAGAPVTTTGATDLVQLTVVDPGCDAGHLVEETRFSGTASRA